MKAKIPVFRRNDAMLKYGDGNAILLNGSGNVTWRYTGVQHKGIGVVACARSGTVYTSTVLRRLGLDIGHEASGNDGSVGYHLAVVKPKNCFHQVRHPLKQINSMAAHRAWGWCGQVVNISNIGLLGCMEYYYMWNKLCEDWTVWRYQLEKFPEIWDEFLDRIGHKKCGLPDVSTTINTHKHKELYMNYTWGDLFSENRQLAQDIMNMADKYGYQIPEMDKIRYQNLGELETAQVASV